MALFMILSDQNLLDLATAKDASMEGLMASSILPYSKLGRYGTEIINILNNSRDASAESQRSVL
jgi:hypothetical protein